MGKNASDFLVQRLFDWGVRRVYGYPGDGISGVFGALDRARDKVRFIQVRHEEMAAFMACAHAKFTGEIGVCIATGGPGAIHLLNGLYDAHKDRQPVLAIVGQQARMALGTDYHQEIDLASLFKDVAQHYVQQASVPSQIRTLVDRAIRISISERCVSCIILPNDLQQEEGAAAPPRKHGAVFTGVGYLQPEIVPAAQDLQRAADVLNAGERVAMLIGIGAMNAAQEVQDTAEILGAGVAKALLGKAVLPDHLPYVTGTIGLLGTQPSWEMMMHCDTLLMIGSSFPYAEFLPREGQARGVQIDLSARQLNLRYPMEVALQGDSKLTLRKLLPLLQRKTGRTWRTQIESNVAEWWELLEVRANQEADPLNPQKVFWEASSRLPDNCILTCDSGSCTFWWARDLKVRAGMLASLSGNLASMCPAIPYAIAAKFCFPGRAVVAAIGDGAMQMLGIAELLTIAKYWREWSNPQLVILVLNNRDLNLVTWEQRILNGDPKFAASQDLPAMNYAQFARELGLEGIELTDSSQVGAAWDQAFAAGRPCVIDAHTDPNVPPLPPHISLEQAQGFMSALFKGDPNELGIIKMSIKQMAGKFIPSLK